MKKNLLYKWLAGGIMVLLLTCSVFVGAVSAQTGELQPENSGLGSQGYDDIVSQRIDEIANPSYDDIVSDRITQTQAESANQSANAASQNPVKPTQDGGSGDAMTNFTWSMLTPWFWVQSAMKILGNTILMFFGWLLGLVGLIFNLIIKITIVDLKKTIDSLGVITDIWKVIRDFINLFFIFALLYAAVGTILGLDKVDWKKTVGNLVLAALLINFSLFITKAALDLSNIVTIGFYSQLPGVGAGDINPGSIVNQTSNAGGISNSIMQSLKLETIYKPSYDGGASSYGDANRNSAVGSFAYILATVMGSIFICVTIVVMVAACWLFLKRFIDIIFLMIRSPIAFAGLVLPQLGEYQKNWWSDLQKNVVFPPVYMAMMWITFKILQSPGFQTVAPGADGFSGLFSTLSGTTVNIAFRFIIVIAMMVYALKSAGKVGVEGGEMFNDFLKKKRDQMAGAVSGAIGRNTLGRGAAMLQDKNSAAGQALRKLESVPIIGAATSKAITGGLKNVSGATFGGAKGGFDQMVKDEAKYAKEGYARVGEKREWREAFTMKEPVNPAPVRAEGESEMAFLLRKNDYEYSSTKKEREDKYAEDMKTYEKARANYTARKETFDEEQKKGAEDRQKQFRGNYEKTSAFSVVGKDRPASIPFLGENRAALKAIDEKIDADKKKESKTEDQNTEWQEALLEFLKHHGEEALASTDATLSPVGNDPTRPGEMSDAARALRQATAAEFGAEKAAIEALTDKKEKADKLGKLWKKYKEVEGKIAEDEVALLETISHRMSLATTTADQKEVLFKQKMRIKKSQRARSELNRKLEKMEEKRDRADEKEREKKEREEKEKKDGGGGGESKGDKK